MSGSRFSTVRKLFGSTSLSTPPEEEDEAPAANAPKGPTQAQVDAVVDAEVAAANTRWNTVMTSEAGIANPKAAARLCNTSTMSADDIVATLGDITVPAAGGAAAPDAAALRQQRIDADRAALNEEEDADPRTGPAGGGPAARSGQGESEKAAARAAAKEQRAKRQKQRNASAEANGGRRVNAQG